MAQIFRIFVYGTLKRQQRNHYVLNDEENGFAKFQSKGKTAQKFPLVVGKLLLTTRMLIFYYVNFFLLKDSDSNIPFLLNLPETGGNCFNVLVFKIL